MSTFDFSGLDTKLKADDLNRPLLPEGETKALIVGFEEGQTKNGSTFLKVKMKVRNPAKPNQQVELHETLWTTTDGAMKMLRVWLSNAAFLALGEVIDVDYNDLIGKTIPVRVSIESDADGKYDDKNRIQPWLTKEQAKEMRAVAKGKLAPAPSPSAPKSKAPKVSVSVEDDEIAF